MNNTQYKELDETFYAIVEDIMEHTSVQEMKEISQHSKHISRFDHCLYVAYTSYVICNQLGLDAEAAARAGMLHDFHEHDARFTKHAFRLLFTHPIHALKQSSELFELSNLEKNIIESHMWPVTISKLPKSREAFIVNAVDTLCAALEMVGYYKRSKKMLRLTALTAMG